VPDSKKNPGLPKKGCGKISSIRSSFPRLKTYFMLTAKEHCHGNR